MRSSSRSGTPPNERPRRERQPLAQRDDRVRPDVGAVALQVDRHELRQRQLRRGGGLAAKLRLDHVAVVRQRGGLGREWGFAAALAVGVAVAQTPAPGAELVRGPSLDGGHQRPPPVR
jgi:hypothetical protein